MIEVDDVLDVDESEVVVVSSDEILAPWVLAEVLRPDTVPSLVSMRLARSSARELSADAWVAVKATLPTVCEK